MEYLTTSEMAVKWGISERRVRKLCDEKRVVGAIKKGFIWLIPADAIKPDNPRKHHEECNDIL